MHNLQWGMASAVPFFFLQTFEFQTLQTLTEKNAVTRNLKSLQKLGRMKSVCTDIRYKTTMRTLKTTYVERILPQHCYKIGVQA